MAKYNPKQIALAVEQIYDSATLVEAGEVRLNGESWKVLANCIDTSPVIFDETKAPDISLAKAICAGCDVVDLCFAYGMNFFTARTNKSIPEEMVYGGRTLAERQKILAS